jgi:hypothetical protein
MSYVDDLLAAGESVRYRTHRHWIVLLRWAGGGFVLVVLGSVMAALFATAGWWQGPAAATGAWVGLGLAGLGVVLTLPGMLRWLTEVYLVTDRRVIQVEGVLRKQALDSGLAKVNDVRLSQTLLGRILGYGTLEIITASESGINRLDQLPRPLHFKRAMMAGQDPGAGVASRPVIEEGATPPAMGVPFAVVTPAVPRPAAERLAELEDLRRRGLLSEAEYEGKREEILRSL